MKAQSVEDRPSESSIDPADISRQLALTKVDNGHCDLSMIAEDSVKGGNAGMPYSRYCSGGSDPAKHGTIVLGI